MIYAFAIVVGLLTALAAGSLSGIAVGGNALGTKLAVFMGCLYGGIAGSAAVVICTLLLAFM